MFMLGSLAATAVTAGFALLLGFNVVQWIAAKDAEVEERREAAQHIATTLTKMGLVEVPKFLAKYAIGDYSGMAKALIALVQLFKSGEENVLKEFTRVADNVINARLATESGRAYLQAQLTLATA
jgi:hypothetical protein